MDLYQIYKMLLDAFGEQGWWPLTDEGEVRPKHTGKKPSKERERFEIVIGAILTQNTSWKNVERAIENLNRENLIDIQKIDEIEINKLAAIIRSAGYFNQKARRLKDFVRFLIDNYDGKLENLFSLEMRRLREELLSIKGIGKETADSIILYSALQPIFVIDAYTKRIMKRLGLGDKNYDELQEMFMSSLPKDQRLFAEYHALLVHLGKNYCKKSKPNCKVCPLNGMCKYPDNLN